MIGHLLQPSGDTETTIRRLVRLAHRNLGLTPKEAGPGGPGARFVVRLR